MCLFQSTLLPPLPPRRMSRHWSARRKYYCLKHPSYFLIMFRPYRALVQGRVWAWTQRTTVIKAAVRGFNNDGVSKGDSRSFVVSVRGQVIQSFVLQDCRPHQCWCQWNTYGFKLSEDTHGAPWCFASSSILKQKWLVCGWRFSYMTFCQIFVKMINLLIAFYTRQWKKSCWNDCVSITEWTVCYWFGTV